MYKSFKYSLFALATTCGSQSFAGGPLVLEGPTGNTPVTYKNPVISVNVETGTLGSLSNAAANALVEQAIDLWNNVSTTTLRLNIDTTQIDIDINLDNYDQYLPKADYSDYNADDNLNPVVYDTNGEITDALLYDNASNDIIGFAASVYTIGSSYFEEGYAVINGKDLGASETMLTLTISHEIAHFFGLDHSQAGINNQESATRYPRFCSTDIPQNYPVMYPIINCRELLSLHSDDISAVSALYPDANINDNFGILQGRFVDESGRPILGANIWVENTASGETYSIASDYLKQRNGYYKLYLPAGSYTLHANAINPEFNGGSSIGPYAASITDLSFVYPNPITPVTFQGDTEGSDEIISIQANQTETINFSSTGGIVILPEYGSDDDSFSDLFGAASHITLSLLITVMITLRRVNAGAISRSQ